MKNKLLSALLICAMLVSLLAVIPFSASAATTITITSVDDWMNKLSGITVGDANINVTAAELDFTGKNLAPVQGFKGTFNGNGVVIKNANVVTEGETLTSISQEYGIQLKKLAHINRMRITDDLQTGQTLKLK